MKPRDRITIERAPLEWANDLVTRQHYLHRPVHHRASPFAYRIRVDGKEAGVIIMATIHFTRQKELFGYPRLPTKWQVLTVARVWINPRYQGITTTDSQGCRHTFPVASCALGKMLNRVQRDWLDHHPPRLDAPYHIRLILAYADTGENHEGTIYRAANFKLWGHTNNNRPRHGTRGEHSGTTKLLYIYRLPQPHWRVPVQGRLI
jgi:hypothetical protein